MKRILLLFFSLQLLSCQKTETDKLLIATAANMQFAMQDIVDAFQENHEQECEIIISSSGKLTAQIKEGAPYDIFVSANMKYPDDLYQSGFTTNAPKIYALGQLVIWSTTDTLNLDMDNLQNQAYIAMANPKNAPYGQAAKEVLEYHGLYESLEDKMVFGESIAQTNQFIRSKAANLGFTAKSVVKSPQTKGIGHYIDIDPKLHAPIQQGVVLLKNSSKAMAAQAFYDFLLSKQSQSILKEYGYLIESNE